MLVFLFFLFNVVDGISLAKMHNSSNFAKIPVAKMDNSDLMSQILESKGDPKALLGVLADADPAKVNEVLGLLRALLADSQNELAALIASSNTADSNYDDAVAAHNAAVVAQSDGLVQLQDALDAANTAAQTTYDQGSTALQAAVDAAQVVVDTTTTAKNTANGVLAADRSRLDSEIATLIQVIALMEGLLGLNTFAPSASPPASPALDTLFYTDSFTGTYDQCVSHCAGLNDGKPEIGNYQIASVHSVEENNAMYTLINANNWGVYLGAEQTSVKGVYEWADGSPWDYTDWGITETRYEPRLAAWTDGTWHNWGNGDHIMHCMCRRH